MADAHNYTVFSSLFDNQQVVFSVCCVVVAYALWTVYAWRGRPPGPWGFPIVGHLPLLGSMPHETLLEYRKRYGDVFTLRMGSGSGIVVSGIDLIKEALVKKTDDFAGRKSNFLFESLLPDKGMTFSDYDERWKIHRKIANQVLRTFAANKKNRIDDLVIEEARLLVSIFQEENGHPFDPHESIYLNVGSVLYQILYGKQENIREDPGYKDIVIDTTKQQEPINMMNIVVVLPWIRYFIPGVMRKLQEFQKVAQALLQKRFDEHKSSFDPENLRDITDGLIKAAKELTESEKSVGLNEQQLMITINEFVGAGFDTVAGTLVWGILYMIRYPEVQAKVHEELDRVVGTSRYPNLNDRSSLPYTQATILELLRITSLAPLAIPHKATKDTEIGGYFIPKDTDVYINLYSVHMDPSWGDPRVFRPERFLTFEGEKMMIDMTIAENILPFGAGRRRCLGEFLAKVELFVFFSYLLQQFKYEAPPNEIPSLDATFGLTLKPKRYNMIATPRF